MDNKTTEDLINVLDTIARNYDNYGYGLPIHNEDLMEQMSFQIKLFLQEKLKKQRTIAYDLASEILQGNDSDGNDIDNCLLDKVYNAPEPSL